MLLLTPFALAYLVYHAGAGAGTFGTKTSDTLLLMGTGLITAIPLMFYANGAKQLRLSTIGVMQYIAPTMIFLTAVFLFNEPFGPARAIAFPMIWAALALYTWSFFAQKRAT